jgi:hypothetical protein
VPFTLRYTEIAQAEFDRLQAEARAAYDNSVANNITKSSNQEGLFKQVRKALGYLAANPAHQSLNTHKFSSMLNPIRADEPVFEAYAQNNTPGAWRIFFIYGPNRAEITVIAITPHP